MQLKWPVNQELTAVWELGVEACAGGLQTASNLAVGRGGQELPTPF